MSLEVVRNYWQKHVCEANGRTNAQIEEERIGSLEFMKPTHYTGLKILEVGVGSGVDFIQWCKAGCDAYGIDLTQAAVEHTRAWLHDLHLNGFVHQGNAENLEFGNNQFDLVYSWGVLHHSPNTAKTIQECIRVCKPGGEIKLMLYNKYSLMWLLTNLNKQLRGVQLESVGTKAFSKSQIREMLRGCQIIDIQSTTCQYDTFWRFNWLLRTVAGIYNYLTGNSHGWFITIRARKC